MQHITFAGPYDAKVFTGFEASLWKTWVQSLNQRLKKELSSTTPAGSVANLQSKIKVSEQHALIKQFHTKNFDKLRCWGVERKFGAGVGPAHHA